MVEEVKIKRNVPKGTICDYYSIAPGDEGKCINYATHIDHQGLYSCCYCRRLDTRTVYITEEEAIVYHESA